MIRYRRSYGPLGLLWFALAGLLIRQHMVASLTLGVGESLGARASRPRRWKINPPYERARRPLSQVTAYALPRRLLRSKNKNGAQRSELCCAAEQQMVRTKISFGAQALLNMVPIGQTPQPNRSIASN